MLSEGDKHMSVVKILTDPLDNYRVQSSKGYSEIALKNLDVKKIMVFFFF